MQHTTTYKINLSKIALNITNKVTLKAESKLNQSLGKIFSKPL